MQTNNTSMEFICNQDWDSMKPIDGGKFCNSCQKKVSDYTSSSLEHILEEYKADSKICGLYRTEQVDPLIIAPVKDVLNNRFFVLLTSLFLGLSTKTVQAQSNPTRVEQHIDFDTTDLKEINTACSDSTNHVCDTNCSCKKIKTETKSKRNLKRKRLYFSKRFPFIRYRRRSVYGRIRVDWGREGNNR